MALVWENPPAVKGAKTGPGRFAEEARQLKEHPGRWARLTTCARLSQASGLQSNITNGLLKELQGFIATRRGLDVYVMWPEDGDEQQ